MSSIVTISHPLTYLQVILDAQPWLYEPSLVEMPWKRSTNVPKTLKIGVMWHDGLVHPHPPVTRGLQETVKALEESGHTVTPWDPALHRGLIDCIDQAYFLDGGAEYNEILAAGNEPAAPLLKWILEKGDPKEHTVSETWTVRKYPLCFISYTNIYS
jgi:amidase